LTRVSLTRVSRQESKECLDTSLINKSIDLTFCGKFSAAASLDVQDQGAVAPEVVDEKGQVAQENGEVSRKKSEVSKEKGAVAQETSHVAPEKGDIAQAKSEGNQEMGEASGEEGAPLEGRGEGAQEKSGSEVALEHGEVAEATE